jgi:hypothetical protein
MGSWTWDMRNETSYEETLHVVAFNCAYYDLFYELCFMYLAIWAGIVSGILEMGWDGLVLSGMNLLFHVSKCFWFSALRLEIQV